MRKARFVILAALAVVAVFGAVTTALFTDEASANNGVQYEYHVGDTAFFGTPCLTIDPKCPAVAGTGDGDTIEIAGSGTLSKPGPVTGSGTFVHKDADGDVVASGTWEATELLSFQPYGPNTQLFPKEFNGGKAQIRVELSTGGTATMTIGCLLGPPRSYPRGGFEGVRVNVDGGLNFDEDELGITLFIRQN